MTHKAEYMECSPPTLADAGAGRLQHTPFDAWKAMQPTTERGRITNTPLLCLHFGGNHTLPPPTALQPTECKSVSEHGAQCSIH